MCRTIAEIYQIDVANFESNFRIYLLLGRLFYRDLLETETSATI